MERPRPRWVSKGLFEFARLVGGGRFRAVYGMEQLHDSYMNGYPDRTAMGFIQPKRIQVKLLNPDLALALTWWSATFPTSKKTVVGNSTMNLQKFSDGWKIIASHTSIDGM
jgi:hypothetical protein